MVGTAAPTKNGKEAQQVPLRPFVAGTRRLDEPVYDETRNLTTTSVDLPTFDVDPNGFLTGLYLFVSASTSGNTATVTAAADAPFSALDLVLLSDTNNQPIIGPMTGYDLYVADKYGGYAFQDDPRASYSFTAVITGAGGTAGGFQFVLYLPIEIVRRDGLGSLPNKSSSSTFNVQLRLAPTTSIYGVAPSSTVAVRTRMIELGWQDPNGSDIRGNRVAQEPPGAQTTQYWSKQTYTLTSGTFDQRLQSIDSLVRMLVWIARDENSARSQGDTEFPDPLTFQYETSIISQRLKTIWQHMISRHYGYFATVETANGRDNGVYPYFDWAQDFEHKVGNESRYGYLPVSSATNLRVSGTIGGSGANLYGILVNKIVPAGGNPLALTGGR